MTDFVRRNRALEQLALINARYAGRGEERRSDGSVRHKCFVSYHMDDAEEALAFVEGYESVFIPKSLGISDDSPLINSTNDDYIMNTIRSEYLADSTVTILLVGKCTWARKFIDWEIYSSLRRDPNNRLNGLLALELPSVAASGARLPARAALNVPAQQGAAAYGRYMRYPTSASSLRSWIDDAFNARSSRSDLIQLGGGRLTSNSTCS